MTTKDRWITIDDPWSYREFEPCGGVYVVYAEGDLIYVGQSTNVRKRVACHDINLTLHNCYRTPWGYFKKLTIKVVYPRKYGEWAMRELRLIRRLHPLHNRLGTTKDKKTLGWRRVRRRA